MSVWWRRRESNRKLALKTFNLLILQISETYKTHPVPILRTNRVQKIPRTPTTPIPDLSHRPCGRAEDYQYYALPWRPVHGAVKRWPLPSHAMWPRRRGYEVQGFAPTSRAVRQIRDAGTLQGLLASARTNEASIERRLHFLGESSLATARQMREILSSLSPGDRELIIGDTRQYQSVEADRTLEQLQQAGMRTAKLHEIMRQKTGDLVRHSHGSKAAGIEADFFTPPPQRSIRHRIR